MAEAKPMYFAEGETDQLARQVLHLTGGNIHGAIGYLLGLLEDTERDLNAIRQAVGAKPKKPFIEILRDNLRVQQSDG
jgi:hypothetical protein